MRTKRIIAVALAAVMLVLTTGCSTEGFTRGKNTTWVYRKGEAEVTAGQYITAQLVEISNFINRVNETVEFAEGQERPQTFEEILKLEVDGKTGTEIVTQAAEEHSKTYFAVLDEYARLGLSQGDEMAKGMANYAGQQWQAEQEYFELNGVSMDSFIEYNMDNLRREELFNALYTEDGEKAPTFEELSQFFIDEFAHAGIVQISLISEDPADEREPEDFEAFAREKAEEFLTRAKAGESAEALQYEYLMESLPAEQTEGLEEFPEGYFSLYVSETTMDTFIQQGMEGLAREVLDNRGEEPILFEDLMNYSIYVVIPKDTVVTGAEDENFAYYEPIVLEEMKLEEYESYLSDLAAGIELTVNEKSVQRYTPDKIKEQYTEEAPAQDYGDEIFEAIG